MKDKKLTSVVAITIILVLLITGLKIAIDKRNAQRADYIEITTVSTREPTTSAEGDSYTYVDENGVQYLVKEDGMYRINDDGTYTYMKDFVNIPIFQNIVFKLANGYTEDYTFNKDSTYSLTTTLNSGDYFKMNGKYEVSNDLGVISNKLGTTASVDGIASFFELEGANLNVNNLYYVKVYYGPSQNFDADGNVVEMQQLEADEEEGNNVDITKMVANEFVIYLQSDGEPDEDMNALVYDITGCAYSITNGFYYIDYSQNKHNELKINTQYTVSKSE